MTIDLSTSWLCYPSRTTMLGDLTATQRKLSEYMSELSEEAYCAGWMEYLEYALWQVRLGERRRYGRLFVTAEHVAELERLSQDCAGWIVFDDQREQMWVPLRDWEARFAAWLKSPARSRGDG